MSLRDRFSRRATISNARWFLAGKLLSALATVSYLGLVTRALLPQGGLAAYLSAIAYLETALALSLFGLDWLLIRHLPAAAAAGDAAGLRHLLGRAVVARVASVCLAVAVLALAVMLLGRPTALEGLVLPLLAQLMLSEALLRLLRDNTLESLAAQRYTQFGVLGRTLLALSGLGLLQASGMRVDANILLGVEAVASFTMLLGVAYWVRRLLPAGHACEVPGGRATVAGFRKAWRACWPNYLAALISLPLAPQSLMLALSYFASAAALAPIGLALRVFEIMRNYVPGLLFMNVLRPRLIGAFAGHGNFARTAVEAGLISRWSAISVAPIIGLLALYGDAALQVFAGRALTPGLGVMLALMAATLLFRVHRQIGQVLVNIVSAQGLLTRLALLGLMGWPLAAWIARQDLAQWALPAALAWDELAWVIGLSLGMRQYGSGWPSHLTYMTMLLALAAGAAFLVSLLPLPSSVLGMVVGALALVGIMAGVLAVTGQLNWRRALNTLRARD